MSLTGIFKSNNDYQCAFHPSIHCLWRSLFPRHKSYKKSVDLETKKINGVGWFPKPGLGFVAWNISLLYLKYLSPFSSLHPLLMQISISKAQALKKMWTFKQKKNQWGGRFSPNLGWGLLHGIYHSSMWSIYPLFHCQHYIFEVSQPIAWLQFEFKLWKMAQQHINW